MATKKSTPAVAEEPENETMQTEETGTEQLKAELAKLKAENEQLRRNNIQANSASGAKTDRERVKEACEMAAKEGADEWEIKISVRAPRKPAKEDQSYWLSVNGRTIVIPANDRYYDLQLPFAAALMDSIAAEWFAADYADSIEEYDPVTNPHKE